MARIIIEIPDERVADLHGLTDWNGPTLFRDAFGEFVTRRLADAHGYGRTPEQYVEARYPSWTKDQKSRKAREVRQRCLWAQAISAHTKLIIEAPPPPAPPSPADPVDSDLDTRHDKKLRDADRAGVTRTTRRPRR